MTPRPLLSRRALFALSGVLVLQGVGCGGASVTVYLARHAEKQSPAPGAAPSKDPSLSELGRRRSTALVAALEGVALSAVFATEFKRTRETVEPTANAHGLEVDVVPADDLAGLLWRIRMHVGGTVLVAGHSNTVPEIAAGLGVPEKVALGDDDYGDLFVVAARGSSATLERRRFEA
jgi:phosphohistidine phosphatase SixA